MERAGGGFHPFEEGIMGGRLAEQSEAIMAASDVVTLVRLAQGAAYRLEERVHGDSYARAEAVAGDLQDLLREAEALEARIKETLPC